MRFIPLLLLHAFQVALSLDAARYSYLAIQALLQVEGIAKKAAKISTKAAEQLHQTRSTEAAGAGAAAISLLCSVFFTYITLASHPTWQMLALNVGLVGAIMAARIHMLNFWRRQRTIPVVAGSFNKGLERSEKVTDRLSWLEITWLTSALVTAWYVKPYAGRV